MNKYSKVKLMNSSTKSRSMDLSDFHSFPDQDQKPTEITTPRFIPRIHKPKSIKKSATATNQEHHHQPPKKSNPQQGGGGEDGDGGQHGRHHQEKDGDFRLKMSGADGTTADEGGTTAAASGFKLEKQSSTRALQSAVKGAFSMRRSSSVSERYCRIHDQSLTFAAPFDDDHEEDEEELQMNRSTNRDKKQRKYSRGSVLKACKRIFGL